MTSQRSVVFAEPVRTAIGTFGGTLKDVSAPALGAAAITAAVARAGIRPDEVQTVVMGNVVQAGTKINPARQAAVHAGLPVSVPALTVNRVCGSGAQAIVSAAQEWFSNMWARFDWGPVLLSSVRSNEQPPSDDYVILRLSSRLSQRWRCPWRVRALTRLARGVARYLRPSVRDPIARRCGDVATGPSAN